MRNRYAIKGLLEWLQDINWPGAFIAMERLKLKKEEFSNPEIYSYLLEVFNSLTKDKKGIING